MAPIKRSQPAEDPRHRRLCSLVKEHCEKHKGWVVLDHYDYEERGIAGEVDVLVANKYGLYFYECKSTNCDSTYLKAKKQFRRFQKAHKDCGQNIYGIYVTPTKVKRLR